MRSNQLSYLAIALKASAKVIEIFIRAKVFQRFFTPKKRSNGLWHRFCPSALRKLQPQSMNLTANPVRVGICDALEYRHAGGRTALLLVGHVRGKFITGDHRPLFPQPICAIQFAVCIVFLRGLFHPAGAAAERPYAFFPAATCSSCSCRSPTSTSWSTGLSLEHRRAAGPCSSD